ncbi:hypothetical protein BDV98DRAFT_608193 [Pterulicium gracile]|uniref:Uncharacterized protein n=1 Tax=Pterulicium gracile TaxID=1884261 RepID=A0A5C3Q8S3_9AGAR|nr:hypothetical protein BDV98DRAFT_608193 [Pterula gracilis]
MGIATSNLWEQTAETGPFKPTPKHAQDARLLLMYHLPRELADRVLDDAEYWPSFTTSTECKLEIASPQGSDSEWSYLVTPPLLDPSSQKMDVISPQDGGAGAPKVKGIRFAVVSHDQGSSWDRENHKTYKGSWTWFEVSILRCRIDPSPKIVQDMTEAPFNFLQFSAGALVRAVRIPDIVDTPRWLVQHNLHADRTPRQHEVVWKEGDPRTEWTSPDSDPVGDTVPPLEVRNWMDSDRGAGLGKGFLPQLRLGDRVVLWAKARYPAWTNCVYTAEMEIFYSA